jgi:hypothetical protein
MNQYTIKANTKEIKMSLNIESTEKVTEFLRMFEAVFHNDWEMSKTCLENPTHLIDEDGTFLSPNVKDESDNWGNRGSLLESYRELCKALEKEGIDWDSLGSNS